ncbi:MAG: hypothetical protein VX278_04810, partial [Myxococcota bacterium]|nr:hypothetical protein [Myxococcota bacterium]
AAFTLYDLETQAALVSKELEMTKLTEIAANLPSFFQDFGEQYLSKISKPKSPVVSGKRGSKEYEANVARETKNQSDPKIDYPTQKISLLEDYTLPNYLYTTSAIPLNVGNAYVSTKEIFYFTGGYGLTDNLTLFGEIFPFPDVGFMMLGTQYSFNPSRNFYIGLEFRSFLDFYDTAIDISGSVAFTFGSAQNNFTLKYVKGSDGNTRFGDFFWSLAPHENFIVFLSGAKKITPKVSVVSENFLYVYSLGDIDLVIHTVDFRYFFQNRSYIDIGLGLTGYDIGDYNDQFLPWIGYTLPFVR